MACKTVVVTGANRGLGFEIVRQLDTDASVSKIYALCRKTSEQLTSLAGSSKKVAVVQDINVSQDDCVAKLQSAFATNEKQPVGIDLLINNAGAYGPPEPFETTREMYESQSLANITMDRMRYAFELNTLGPLRVTKALLPNMLSSSTSTRKVIIISSLMGSIADNEAGGAYAYRASKAAVNMVGKDLALDLGKHNIAVGIVHPGFVLTGFQAKATEEQPGQHDVEPSAKGVLEAIDDITMENTGAFLHGNYGDGVKPLSW